LVQQYPDRREPMIVILPKQNVLQLARFTVRDEVGAILEN
jgi:hypothetical protein